MFVDEILLATRDEEIDYFNSGEHTTDMPLGYVSARPFGIFPRLGIEKLSLGRITLFCGSSITPIDYLLRVVASLLGASDCLENDDARYVSEYKRFCITRHRSQRRAECVFVGKDQITQEMNKIRKSRDYKNMISMEELYDDRINGEAIYVIEMPECGMSVEECASVADLIYDTSKHTGAQFIISTNSPIFMGIKGALIYDFDRRPLVPQPYYRSSVRKSFTRINEQICASHTRKKD
ncbi:MAG: hypothetical protein E7653_00350 [Ruminococcaceae bacterium]|nr:hypothetical protein [Oscillospiraceae bacterium]